VYIHMKFDNGLSSGLDMKRVLVGHLASGVYFNGRSF